MIKKLNFSDRKLLESLFRFKYKSSDITEIIKDNNGVSYEFWTKEKVTNKQLQGKWILVSIHEDWGINNNMNARIQKPSFTSYKDAKYFMDENNIKGYPCNFTSVGNLTYLLARHTSHFNTLLKNVQESIQYLNHHDSK